MLVERRQRLASAEDAIEAGQSLKQGHEIGLTLEDQSRAALRHLRDKTDEIQRIAIAAFGVKKDCFTG